MRFFGLSAQAVSVMKISKRVPKGVIPHNPFPVTAHDEPQLIDPNSEPSREETNQRAFDVAEFMMRTRRYYRLTHRAPKLQYARGLDSKPEDFA